MADRRWDGDERGDGVADAATFVDGAAELIAAMRRPNWVAEQPEVHLLPHLERACEPLPLRILAARVMDDGSGAGLTFDVVTGIVDEMPLKPHGHTLRLSVAAAL
jgi:hypothetical protein